VALYYDVSMRNELHFVDVETGDRFVRNSGNTGVKSGEARVRGLDLVVAPRASIERTALRGELPRRAEIAALRASANRKANHVLTDAPEE
jgi:hypothetical protein